MPPETELVWQQGLLDVLLEYAIQSDHSSFAISPTLARLGFKTTTVLRFLPPGSAERAYQFRGEERQDTDTFFTVLIGISGVLAIIALLAAAFLVKIYVPAPLPI